MFKSQETPHMIPTLGMMNALTGNTVGNKHLALVRQNHRGTIEGT